MTAVARPAAAIAMDAESFRMLLDGRSLARLGALTRIDTGRLVEDFADPAHAATLAEAEVLVTGWGCPPLTEQVLERMPRLRAVVHCAGSVKGHVTEACWDRGIKVSSAAAVNALPVAEYTLASILFAGKRVQEIAHRYRRDRRRRDWAQVFAEWGNYRLVVGIVGASRIGRRVIELLRPFDIDVLVHDPHLDAPLPGTRLLDLDTVILTADVVSIHAPDLPSTRNMVDGRRLALLKDGATLINTARGSLVDTEALTAELASGRINAVIDTTEPEILPADSPLFELPNVLLTPHIAGSFGNEIQRMVESALDEVERFAHGQPFLEPVRPDTLVHSA